MKFDHMIIAGGFLLWNSKKWLAPKRPENIRINAYHWKNIHLTEYGDVSLFVTEVMLSFDRSRLTIPPTSLDLLKILVFNSD